MGSLERQAAAMSGIATDKPEAEARILWSAPEGQVTNAGVFLLALLLCWLVLPVAWALYCYLRTANHRYILTDQRLLGKRPANPGLPRPVIRRRRVSSGVAGARRCGWPCAWAVA